MKLKLGDTVTWTSQSLGCYTTKTGQVSAIVPKDCRATDYGYKPNGGVAGAQRNHESYVVKVGYRTYWPRVSQLKKVEERDGRDSSQN